METSSSSAIRKKDRWPTVLPTAVLRLLKRKHVVLTELPWRRNLSHYLRSPHHHPPSSRIPGKSSNSHLLMTCWIRRMEKFTVVETRRCAAMVPKACVIIACPSNHTPPSISRKRKSSTYPSTPTSAKSTFRRTSRNLKAHICRRSVNRTIE